MKIGTRQTWEKMWREDVEEEWEKKGGRGGTMYIYTIIKTKLVAGVDRSLLYSTLSQKVVGRVRSFLIRRQHRNLAV